MDRLVFLGVGTGGAIMLNILRKLLDNRACWTQVNGFNSHFYLYGSQLNSSVIYVGRAAVKSSMDIHNRDNALLINRLEGDFWSLEVKKSIALIFLILKTPMRRPGANRGTAQRNKENSSNLGVNYVYS